MRFSNSWKLRHRNRSQVLACDSWIPPVKEGAVEGRVTGVSTGFIRD